MWSSLFFGEGITMFETTARFSAPLFGTKKYVVHSCPTMSHNLSVKRAKVMKIINIQKTKKGKL